MDDMKWEKLQAEAREIEYAIRHGLDEYEKEEDEDDMPDWQQEMQAWYDSTRL